MSIFIGKTGQSIYDVAFMCYGEYDVLKLMSENSFITDVNYSDFGGKTINYTSVNNNASFFNGLSNKIMNTGAFNPVFISTNSKQFQDGISFEFMDGIIYEFQ